MAEPRVFVLDSDEDDDIIWNANESSGRSDVKTSINTNGISRQDAFLSKTQPCLTSSSSHCHCQCGVESRGLKRKVLYLILDSDSDHDGVECCDDDLNAQSVEKKFAQKLKSAGRRHTPDNANKDHVPSCEQQETVPESSEIHNINLVSELPADDTSYITSDEFQQQNSGDSEEAEPTPEQNQHMATRKQCLRTSQTPHHNWRVRQMGSDLMKKAAPEEIRRPLEQERHGSAVTSHFEPEISLNAEADPYEDFSNAISDASNKGNVTKANSLVKNVPEEVCLEMTVTEETDTNELSGSNECEVDDEDGADMILEYRLESNTWQIRTKDQNSFECLSEAPTDTSSAQNHATERDNENLEHLKLITASEEDEEIYQEPMEFPPEIIFADFNKTVKSHQNSPGLDASTENWFALEKTSHPESVSVSLVKGNQENDVRVIQQTASELEMANSSENGYGSEKLQTAVSTASLRTMISSQSPDFRQVCPDQRPTAVDMSLVQATIDQPENETCKSQQDVRFLKDSNSERDVRFLKDSNSERDVRFLKDSNSEQDVRFLKDSNSEQDGRFLKDSNSDSFAEQAGLNSYHSDELAKLKLSPNVTDKSVATLYKMSDQENRRPGSNCTSGSSLPLICPKIEHDMLQCTETAATRIFTEDNQNHTLTIKMNNPWDNGDYNANMDTASDESVSSTTWTSSVQYNLENQDCHEDILSHSAAVANANRHVEKIVESNHMAGNVLHVESDQMAGNVLHVESDHMAGNVLHVESDHMAGNVLHVESDHMAGNVLQAVAEDLVETFPIEARTLMDMEFQQCLKESKPSRKLLAFLLKSQDSKIRICSDCDTSSAFTKPSLLWGKHGISTFNMNGVLMVTIQELARVGFIDHTIADHLLLNRSIYPAVWHTSTDRKTGKTMFGVSLILVLHLVECILLYNAPEKASKVVLKNTVTIPLCLVGQHHNSQHTFWLSDPRVPSCKCSVIMCRPDRSRNCHPQSVPEEQNRPQNSLSQVSNNRQETTLGRGLLPKELAFKLLWDKILHNSEQQYGSVEFIHSLQLMFPPCACLEMSEMDIWERNSWRTVGKSGLLVDNVGVVRFMGVNLFCFLDLGWLYISLAQLQQLELLPPDYDVILNSVLDNLRSTRNVRPIRENEAKFLTPFLIRNMKESRNRLVITPFGLQQIYQIFHRLHKQNFDYCHHSKATFYMMTLGHQCPWTLQITPPSCQLHQVPGYEYAGEEEQPAAISISSGNSTPSSNEQQQIRKYFDGGGGTPPAVKGLTESLNTALRQTIKLFQLTEIAEPFCHCYVDVTKSHQYRFLVFKNVRLSQVTIMVFAGKLLHCWKRTNGFFVSLAELIVRDLLPPNFYFSQVKESPNYLLTNEKVFLKTLPRLPPSGWLNQDTNQLINIKTLRALYEAFRANSRCLKLSKEKFRIKLWTHSCIMEESIGNILTVNQTNSTENSQENQTNSAGNSHEIQTNPTENSQDSFGAKTSGTAEGISDKVDNDDKWVTYKTDLETRTSSHKEIQETVKKYKDYQVKAVPVSLHKNLSVQQTASVSTGQLSIYQKMAKRRASRLSNTSSRRTPKASDISSPASFQRACQCQHHRMSIFPSFSFLQCIYSQESQYTILQHMGQAIVQDKLVFCFYKGRQVLFSVLNLTNAGVFDFQFNNSLLCLDSPSRYEILSLEEEKIVSEFSELSADSKSNRCNRLLLNPEQLHHTLKIKKKVVGDSILYLHQIGHICPDPKSLASTVQEKETRMFHVQSAWMRAFQWQKDFWEMQKGNCQYLPQIISSRMKQLEKSQLQPANSCNKSVGVVNAARNSSADCEGKKTTTDGPTVQNTLELIQQMFPNVDEFSGVCCDEVSIRHDVKELDQLTEEEFKHHHIVLVGHLSASDCRYMCLWFERRLYVNWGEVIQQLTEPKDKQMLFKQAQLLHAFLYQLPDSIHKVVASNYGSVPDSLTRMPWVAVNTLVAIYNLGSGLLSREQMLKRFVDVVPSSVGFSKFLLIKKQLK